MKQDLQAIHVHATAWEALAQMQQGQTNQMEPPIPR